MRMIRTIPKTNLQKLAAEVLSRGPSAALPKNLPDRWLRAIARDLMRVQKAELEGKENDPSLDLAGPLLLVAALRAQEQKSNFNESIFSADDLKEDLEDFAVAIADEILGRETGVFLRRQPRYHAASTFNSSTQ